MRIKSIRANDIRPVMRFGADELSDVVVFAGRNGVGKTRLLEAIINCFTNPVGLKNVQLVLEATCEEERLRWNKQELHTADHNDAVTLQKTLQENRFRNNWKTSVLNIESDRSIQQIYPYSFTFDAKDPDKETIGWNTTFSGLRNRYQDTIHSIFRKVHANNMAISEKARELRRAGAEEMSLDFEDPLLPFKTAFRQLLAPKELLDADLSAQQLKFQYNGDHFLLSSLSSGEREVVNVVFDLILRSPSDCVVFFDEPELHLHPELSYKLIQTLTSLGKNNQFIFCTHSPDIITASLDNSVIFVSPPGIDVDNQAVPVAENDDTNLALKLLGQSVGVVALGKKIVLVEGTTASLDKQTYGAILKSSFPDLVLVPSGGKGIIRSFSTLVTDVLEKSIWGVEFYMLCDRDAVPPSTDASQLEVAASRHFRILPRYHLENYFLDETLLAQIFAQFEPDSSWLTSPHAIRTTLKEIASDILSYTAALYVSSHIREQVGNVDVMPKDCHRKSPEQLVSLVLDRAKTERERIESTLTLSNVTEIAEKIIRDIRESVEMDDDRWKSLVPGRTVLNVFASKARIQQDRLKRLYIAAASAAPNNPFEDVLAIFRDFSRRE